MRLVAMCVAGLLLMQLPATASIVSSTSIEFEGAASWNWTWDAAQGLIRLPGFEASVAAESFEQMLARMKADGFEVPFPLDSQVAAGPMSWDMALLTSLGDGADHGTENLYTSRLTDEDTYEKNIQLAATSVCPEPTTLTIWGISALALAAATYRRQKRKGRNSQHVQAAVKEYLAACETPGQHFRMLGSYLTRLADDPNWTKQDVEAFYDEVVVALHRRREHAEVA